MVVRRLLAALLFLPVLVSCSDDDPDSPDTGDPTTPVTSQPTPTETPPPTEPPEAGDRTKAGAEAFVGHWIATLNYAAASGDTSTFKDLSAAGCNSCVEIVSLIDSTYERGGYIRSDGWSVVDVIEVRPSPSSTVVLADLEFSPETLVRRRGADPEFREGATEGATFELVWSSNGWNLTEFAQGY